MRLSHTLPRPEKAQCRAQMTAKALPRLDEDTRLVPLLNNLSQGFLAGVTSEWSGADSAEPGSEIRAEMVNDIAHNHYPMCMRNLHDSLRKDKHLKHYGRLQYGLFLKVCSPRGSSKSVHVSFFAGTRAVDRGGSCFLAKVI